MPKAYVGIASWQGLADLQPERDDTLSLVHRSVRSCSHGIGFWAVLGDADAMSIQTLFRTGQRREAMLLLDRCAKDIGQILPEDLRPIRPH